MLLHRPDTLVELDELAEVLAQLSQSGKVAHFGLSNVTAMQVELFQSISPVKFEVNQLQFGLGHAGMIHQEFHANMSDAANIDHDGGILAYSRLKKMTIQAWSPLQYGFFTGSIIGNQDFAELNQLLVELADSFGVTPTAIALAWILRHPAQIQVLAGSMNPTHIEQLAEAANVQLSREQWYLLYQAAGNILP